MRNSGMKNSPHSPRRMNVAARMKQHLRMESRDLRASFPSSSTESRKSLAARMKPLLLCMESRDLGASFASSSAESTKEERLPARDGPRFDHPCSAPPEISIADAAKLVTEEFFSQENDEETIPMPSPQVWEDSDASTSSKSTDSTPSSKDTLAREVGLSAQEYLEECFLITEVSVLNKDKFDAVPEIVKSDFTVLGFLGKGSFSDVFEVVHKDGGLPGGPVLGNETGNDNGKSSRSGRRVRLQRSWRARSICTGTMAPPSLGSKRPSFALKCLRPQIRSDAEQFAIGAEDLVHETAMLASLSHPNIIKLHGRASGHLEKAFALNDGYFILTEKLADTLPHRIDSWKRDPNCFRRGPTPQQLRVVSEVAEAMAYLHSKRIIFRDLKPANVGFDAGGAVKLFDFGFAMGLPTKDEANPEGYIFDMCGTARYMAPEVGLQRGYGLKSDVYSLGVLLWEVCAMSMPFAHIATPDEFDARVFVGGERPKIESHWPAAARDLMARCWSVRPGERPLMLQARSWLSSAMKGAKVN